MRSAWLGLVPVVVALSACRGPSAEPMFSPPPPAPSGTASPGPVVVDGGFAGPFEPPALHVVLDDARLSLARGNALVHDWSAAALALDAARPIAPATPLTPAEDCAWTYASARLHLAAGDLGPAATGFDRVAGLTVPKLECRLAGYASLRGAQVYVKLGQLTLASHRAVSVPADLALRDEASLVVADALAADGDRAGALKLWRAHAANPKAPWVDTALKIASALLDGVDGDPASHAAEARDLATRVMVEAPKIAESSGAEATRARAIALLTPPKPGRKGSPKAAELDPSERARQARAWLDAGDSAKAFALATPLLAAPDKSVACSAAVTRAQASTHMPKVNTADAWGDAITRCAGEDALVTALYYGGKASAGAKRTDDAADRLTKVEQLFPRHRLADDARLQGALVALQQGDESRYTSMLLALPDDYPEGDMRGEALFRVALLRMTKGDWEGAKPVLDRITSLFPDDRHWATEGRAAYFRARASAATGDAADAKARYAKIVESCPLAFYMTQAFARLAEADAASAHRLLDAAVAREEPGTFFTRDHPELRSKAFGLGLALLEVGDLEGARREMAAAGLTNDGADAELVWALGQLYDRAGAPELGHAFARARVSDHLTHYPAGRWRPMWEVAFPPAFDTFVARETTANGIPRSLAWAIMREESDFYPEVKSPANAYGLMQLIVPTARGVASGTPYGWNEDALKRPEVSIALGTKLLAGLRASFANRALAIAAYNGGAGAVGRWVAARPAEDFDLWVEEIPWDETRGYIKRVLASEAAYAFLYDKGSLDEVLSIPARVSAPPAPAAVTSAAPVFGKLE